GLTSGTYPLSCVLLRQDIGDQLRHAGQRVPAFTHGLSDAAAAFALDCLARYDVVRGQGGFKRRRELIASCLNRITSTAPQLRVDSTDTTLRIGVTDGQHASRIRRALEHEGVVTYEGSAAIADEVITFFFAFPYFDIDDQVVREVLERFLAAVLAERDS